MDIKTIGASVVTIAVAVLVSLSLQGTATQTIVKEVSNGNPKVGALTGPDIPSSYLRWGGMRIEHGSMAMTAATTTVCAIQSPAATSTLSFWSYNITTATSTAAIFDVSTSTTAFATSSANGALFFNQRTIASGATDSASLVATTTERYMLPPNAWIVMKTGAGLGGYTWGGSCQAEFIVH